MRPVFLFLVLVLVACGPAASPKPDTVAESGTTLDFGERQSLSVDGATVSIPTSFTVESDGMSGFERVDQWVVPTVDDVIDATHAATGYAIRVDLFLHTNPQGANIIVDWVERDCKKLQGFAKENGTQYDCDKQLKDGVLTLTQAYQLKDGKFQWIETTFVQTDTTLWALTVTGRDDEARFDAFRKFAESVAASSTFVDYSNATKAEKAMSQAQQMKKELE